MSDPRNGGHRSEPLRQELEHIREDLGARLGKLEGQLQAHREFLFGNGHGGLVERLAHIDAGLKTLHEWQERQMQRAEAAWRLAEERRNRLQVAYLTLSITLVLTLAGWAVTLFGGG